MSELSRTVSVREKRICLSALSRVINIKLMVKIWKNVIMQVQLQKYDRCVRGA